MELLTLLITAIVLVLVISLLSRLGVTEQRLNDLKGDLREVLSVLRTREERTPAPVPGAVPESVSTPVPEPASEPASEIAPVVEVATLEEAVSPAPEALEPAPVYQGAAPPPLPKRQIAAAAEKVIPAKPKEPSRFEASAREILGKIWNWIVVGDEHRDKGVTMEFAVATTWLIRIGVLILVIGIGFFLKYSIARGFIGPVSRVFLTTVTGAGLVAWGLRLFKGRYGVLGQGLAGAGFATLYFSFFTAHQPDYAIIGTMPAFALMVLVTVVAGVVAIRFNSLLVAVLGLLGGYGTPLMISTGNASVVGLFSYVLLLGLGMFFIASRKNWRLLHYLSFFATYILVLMATDKEFRPERFWEFMPFLLAFFALFSSVTFVYQLIHRRTATLLELLFLFLNAGVLVAFAVGYIQSRFEREAIAILTLGLAIFYIVHIVVFLKRDIRDRGLLLSFMGLAAFFVAITLPLVLSKGWITVSWALQAFVMLWIASKMKSEFLRQLAYLLYLVVLARFALFDLEGQFGGLAKDLPFGEYAMALVERLAVFGIPIASFFAAGRLFTQEGNGDPAWVVGEGNDIKPWFGQSVLSRVCFWVVVALTFVYLNLEVLHSVGSFYDPLVRPSLTLVWLGLGALLLREMLANRESVAKVFFWMLAAAVVIKVFLFDFIYWNPGFDLAFERNAFVPGFLMRALDYGAVAVFLIFVSQVLGKTGGRVSMARIFGYAALVSVFIYSSLEVWTGLTRFLSVFRMGGISIFWSLFALALLLAGISKNRSALRAMGLILLAGVVFKVFFVDLAGLDQLYRIVAFIVLGIVVLVGSFLYFKFSSRFETTSVETETDSTES